MLQSPPGTHITIGGQTYLNFIGTDYLGLAAREESIDAACGAIRKFGLTSSNVRTQYGTHEPLIQAETRLADFFRTERAVLLQSGMSAAQAVAQLLANEACDACILHDKDVHPAGIALVRSLGGAKVDSFAHLNSMDLFEKIHANRDRPIVVVTDSIAGGTGRGAPLGDYREILRQAASEATLVVDESHAVGLLGRRGRGLLETFDLPSFSSATNSPRIVSFASTGKALGVPGGVIPCDRSTAEALIDESTYTRAASPPAPGPAAAIARNVEIMRDEPELRARLTTLRRRLLDRLTAAGIPSIDVSHASTPIVALTLGTERNARTCEQLKSQGILVAHSRYAGTITGDVLRIALRADHANEQIDRLAAALAEVFAG